MEAFAVRILDRLAEVDEEQGYRVLMRPLLQSPADELGIVVQNEFHRAVPLVKEA
jgi:hypothetical protein